MTLPRCTTCTHPAWVHLRGESGERFCETSLRHPRRCSCRLFVPATVTPEPWAGIIGQPPRPGIIRAVFVWHEAQLRKALT